MQAYDIIMLVVVAAATLFGMIKGFAWQVASLASIILSYFVAYRFRDEVASKIQADAPWNLFLAMLLLYAGSSFAIWVVFRLISGSIDRVRLRDFDRQMGALFGLGKGALYCMLITLFAVTLLGPRQQHAIVQSRSGHYISRMLAAAEGVVLPRELDAIIRPHLDRAKQRLDHEGSGPDTASGPAIAAGGWPNLGQGTATEPAIPSGWPTSQQVYAPENLNAALDAAKGIMQWNGGGQPGSIPDRFGGQPSAAMSGNGGMPNSPIGMQNNPFVQPPSSGQYNAAGQYNSYGQGGGQIHLESTPLPNYGNFPSTTGGYGDILPR